MKSHEEKESTRASSCPAGQGGEENANSGGPGAESTANGGGEKEPVAYRKGQHRPPFKGGEVFGRLTLIEFSYYDRVRRFHYWRCACNCGNEAVVCRSKLLSGETTSCGCRHREEARKRRFKHGESGDKSTSEYTAWQGMIDRCGRAENKSYPDYGGRGITVCERWRKSFPAFLEDVGRKPSPKHSIDRKDTNGDYEPSNCRWATPKQQSNNQRRNIILTYKNHSATLAEWAETTSIHWATLRSRLRAGWTVEQTLETPVNYNNKCLHLSTF